MTRLTYDMSQAIRPSFQVCVPLLGFWSESRETRVLDDAFMRVPNTQILFYFISFFLPYFVIKTILKTGKVSFKSHGFCKPFADQKLKSSLVKCKADSFALHCIHSFTQNPLLVIQNHLLCSAEFGRESRAPLKPQTPTSGFLNP